MAKFILDGQEYGGGGSGSNIVKLTQAEYDALSNDKLSNDTIYLITDSGELAAENLFYDGSQTGLGNNVQGAIDSCFQSVSNGKALLASAITDMEVETDATATFEVMAENIRSIETGVDTSGATATAEHITQGFTAWVNGELIVGTRPQAPNTLSGSGSTWKDWDQMTMSGSVTFSVPFDTVPTVTARVSYAADGNYGVTGHFAMSVSNVTRSGFDWRITTSSWKKPASISFTWTAKTA